MTAAVEAAPRFSDSALVELAARMKAVGAAVRQNQYYDAAQADLSFHRLIWETSGNQTLYRMLDQVAAPLFAFVSMRQSQDLAELRRSVRSHEPIFEAVRARKIARIRAAVRDHLTISYRQYLETTSLAGGIDEIDKRRD